MLARTPLDETPLLFVSGLSVEIKSRGGLTRVVDNVSFSVRRGEVLGIVGESGCGKSITMLSLLRLLPNGARVTGGTAQFEGSDLLAMPDRRLRQVRGARIGFVFQDPLTSLNPVMRIGDQLAETLIEHQAVGRRAARAEAGRLLRVTGVPGGEQRLGDYPHQLSGGMRQRVMIAMSIACGPSLLIADEPTTALDVTIQRQIVDLIDGLRQDFGMAVIWVSHDLSLLRQIAHRIAVFYAGTVVEEGVLADVFADPRHPYTQGLIASIPGLRNQHGPLYSIPGAPPDLGARPAGCPFHPRCSYRFDRCLEAVPQLSPAADPHRAACFLAEQVPA